MSTINAIGNGLSGTTGTGNFVGANTPSLITPVLGTPNSGTLTNCSGLPISGIASLGTNVGTALANATNGTGGFPVETDGTWTPVLSIGGSSTGIVYTHQAGFYSRIGNTVTISMYLAVSSIASLTGSATITGLPYNVRNLSDSFASLTIWATSLTLTGSPQCYVQGNTETILLTQITSGIVAVISNTAFGSGSGFIITGTYLI